MKLTIEDSARMRNALQEEQEKINAARSEIVECKSLEIIDYTTYKHIMDHLDEKFEHLRAMYDVVEKHDRIYNYVPVTGPMARKTPRESEALIEEEKNLLRAAYEIAFPA